VQDLAYLVAVGLRTHKGRDGVAMRRWRTLQRLLKEVADLADTGNAELSQDDDEALLPAEDLISTCRGFRQGRGAARGQPRGRREGGVGMPDGNRERKPVVEVRRLSVNSALSSMR
jgi:hypothetical protein